MKQELWTQNIKKNIGVFSDLERQRKAWIEGDLSAGSLSWYEEICDLFDSNLFEEYLLAAKATLEPSVYAKLLELKERLDAYEGHEEDSEILKDPEWVEITKLAHDTVDLWS